MNAPERSHTNQTWDELGPGDEGRIERPVSARDLHLFSHASGNRNPMHMPGSDVDGDGTVDTVAPSNWIASLVATVLGNLMPGPGTLLREQQLEFVERARIGDVLAVRVRVAEKLEKPRVAIDALVSRVADGAVIARGRAIVDAPTRRILIAPAELPAVLLDEHDHFARLIETAAGLGPMATAVVWPDDAHSLGGALLSMREGLIAPVLVIAREALQRAVAALDADVDLEALEIIEAANPPAAAALAVQLVHQGRVRAIMKGNLHSDELLAQVVRRDGGLRSGRRISHVFVLNVPTLGHPLFISDAAINIAPDLMTKVDIVQNAIDLARACGVDLPRVGVLSAIETVNPNMASSTDAAILAKMADRGQIRGGIVDGPLAMDNAIDAGAARIKGLHSPVAGAAQVLIVPNLEAGNMLAKQLTFLSRAQSAGLVVGARVPVMLTSRADNDRARLASCALAQLYDVWQREGLSAVAPPDARKAAS